MHRRSHSGVSNSSTIHSSIVRSLVDSPGSDDCDTLESDRSTHRNKYDENSESSCAFDHINEALTLPLHKQNPRDVRYLSSNDALHNGGSKTTRQHYQHAIEKGAINMKKARQKLSKSQKENKRPSHLTISRQSTFESISTHQSDYPDISGSIAGSVRVSTSPDRSRTSLLDIDEQSRGSLVSADPLVLGGEPSSNNHHNYNNLTHQNEDSNALVLTNDTKSGEVRNPTLKNLLSNVQLPLPRLIPFSPMLTKETPSLSPRELQNKTITAASFAKQAPKAGYLRKLGTSVSEYKRRFFVLKPTTCLYYFLSPNDEEPRGCIDLDGFVEPTDTSGMGGMKVNSLGSLPDGRFRFECVLPLQNIDGDGEKVRKVLLEARNEDIGKEWMNALTVERLSYAKATGKLLEEEVHDLEREKENLKKHLNELRLVEKDRDGAIEDAKAWRQRAERLDDGLNLLKRWLLRSPDDNKDMQGGIHESSGDDDSGSHQRPSTCSALSLSISKEDQTLDEIDLHDTNFSSLANACRGLKENLRLTSIETNTALDDLKESNKRVKGLEERVAKAEKYICKLWEENCSARESLKQRKNEKKILVNEVKSMIEKARSSEKEIETLMKEKEKLEGKCRKLAANAEIRSAENRREMGNIQNTRNKCERRNGQLNTPEKKLLLELEQHVNSSFVQYEYLLKDGKADGSTEFESPPRVQTSSKSNECAQTIKKSNASCNSNSGLVHERELPHKQFEARDGETSSDGDHSQSSAETDTEDVVRSTSHSPLRPKNLTLMDQVALKEVDEKMNHHQEDKDAILATTRNSPCALSLTSENLEVFEESQREANENEMFGSKGRNIIVSPDDGMTSEHKRKVVDVLDAEHSTSCQTDLSLKSLFTDNGKATSKLACPLKDVIQSSNDGRVYSLTFYTQRIGLQFQKVPGNVGQNGLLTEAMTADLKKIHPSDSATISSRTEAELRLIASLSNPNQTSKCQDPIKDQSCPVIFPTHNVLVCGFQGFDATSNKRKPSLGAKLVGFDGISIERGPWTFEAVRRAIKARDRPLALTFRDDYLTTEQRIILTKAANDVEQSSNQPPRPTSRRGCVPATINAVTKASDRIVKSPSFSDISRDLQSQDDNTTLSNSSRSSDNWKTFSDAGSSVLSSKFSPLISNLVSGTLKGEKKKGTSAEGQFSPGYFRRSNDSLDSSPSHQYFKASLL